MDDLLSEDAPLLSVAFGPHCREDYKVRVTKRLRAGAMFLKKPETPFRVMASIRILMPLHYCLTSFMGDTKGEKDTETMARDSIP